MDFDDRVDPVIYPPGTQKHVEAVSQIVGHIGDYWRWWARFYDVVSYTCLLTAIASIGVFLMWPTVRQGLSMSVVTIAAVGFITMGTRASICRSAESQARTSAMAIMSQCGRYAQ